MVLAVMVVVETQAFQAQQTLAAEVAAGAT
jgi:hypothetical protein